VVEIMEQAEGYLDAATLRQRAAERDAQIDRATVYRTLDLLRRLKLIDELNLPRADAEAHSPAHHDGSAADCIQLACLRCGDVEEWTYPHFENAKSEILVQSGFEVRLIRSEATGLCRKCSGAEVEH
jgi:Fe2+ or Zn2+ uptake regulation protein